MHANRTYVRLPGFLATRDRIHHGIDRHLAEDADPAGTCYALDDDTERIAFEESSVDGERLVIVATSGQDFSAEDMLQDWHGRPFTTAWQDVGWLDEISTTGR